MSTNSAWTGSKLHINESDLKCRTGCGFYGNVAWEGHCSKCYKEKIKKASRKNVFDPAQLKNKVSRSVSDVSELQSKATSLMSSKFDKFEEKRKQQLEKKSKAIKSILRKSNTLRRDSPSDHSVRHNSYESEPVSAEFNTFLKEFGKDIQANISKQINLFVEKISKSAENYSVNELSEEVQKFYNHMNHMVSTQVSFLSMTQEDVKKLNILTERYITSKLYKTFISQVNAEKEEEDLALQDRIRSLIWVSTCHLDSKINENDTKSQQILDQVISDLIGIDSKKTPSDKLELLKNISLEVMEVLKESSKGEAVSADDFLPGLIYTIIRANPPLLQSNITYITNFAQQGDLQSGEAGYFFTNLCCAVAFIERLNHESLGLTQPEFDRYMSGDALPHNALQPGGYMCEGLQLMQNNLKNMDNLMVKITDVVTGYETLEFELQTLVDDVELQVNDILAKTPLNIRPKKANIDEEDPNQDLLPPPIMPQVLSSTSVTESTSNEPHQLSPDSLTVQKSLQFLEELESTRSPSNDNLLTVSPHIEDTSICENSLLGSSFGSSGSLLDEPLPHDSIATIPSLDPTYSIDFTDSATSLPYMGYSASTSPIPSKGYGDKSVSYTGFSIQGGKIESIPCDTGNVVSPRDPLSPPFSPQNNSLPPPLVPTIQTPTSGPANFKDDPVEKVVNVLGDIVETFDNLL